MSNIDMYQSTHFTQNSADFSSLPSTIVVIEEKSEANLVVGHC